MPVPPPTNPITPKIPSSLATLQIPLEQWSKTYPIYSNLAVSALIFDSTSRPTSKILLVKRSAHDSFPNIWEVPGGSVDLEDATMLDALTREVWEETGLRVQNFVGEVFEDKTRNKRVSFGGRKAEERWRKYYFLVEVETPYEVKLDPNEHQDWGWFSREEAKGVEMVSEDAYRIVENAFEAVF